MHLPQQGTLSPFLNLLVQGRLPSPLSLFPRSILAERFEVLVGLIMKMLVAKHSQFSLPLKLVLPQA
jgi:hypothetical protein